MIEWLNTVGVDLVLMFMIASVTYLSFSTSHRVSRIDSALRRLHEAVWEHDNE
jgi:hypothetical protein